MRKKRGSWAAILLLLLLAGSLTGCAAEVAKRPAEGGAHSPLRWPPPPLAPRIEWVGEIRSVEEAGVAKGFWRRLVEAVTGESARPFVRPYGVLADPRQRLVVVDTGAARVHLIDREKGRHAVLGGEENGAFISPVAVAEDDRDHLFITDSAAGTVHQYDMQRRRLTVLLRNRLQRPTGIAFNRGNGLLYVSDTDAHQVVAFDRGGIERLRIGRRGSEPGAFNFPTDLFIDRLGQLYVTDALNHRIQIFTPAGQPVASFGLAGDAPGYFDKPKGVAVNSEGHVFVVDALIGAVQIFDPAGRLLLGFGGAGNRPGEFWLPAGISIDANDCIYVSDSYNRRIQVFRYLSAAAGTSAAAADGAAFEGAR